MTSTALFRRLLSYSFRYWKGFALAILAMAITAATETAFPAMMKPLLDKGFSGATSFQVWWVPTAVLLIFVTRGAASFVAQYSMQWVSNNVLRDIRQTMFDKLITMPASTFDTTSSGQLIARMISEAQMVLYAVTGVITILIRDSLVLIGLMGWMFWLNWKLTLVVILVMPLLALMTLKFAKRMRRVSHGQMAATSEMTTTVEEAISGNRVIKVFGGESYEQSRFDRVNRDYRSQAMRLAIAQALQSPISQLIAALGVAIVLTIALMQSRAGSVTAGDFISFITAMLMMFSPLKHLADINAQLQRGLAAAQGVFALIDEDSERDRGTLSIQRVRGDIEYKDVSSQYPNRDRPALDHVSLRIPAGQTYALVGPSGGGKTTFVNLLPRLYELDFGTIAIDGTNIQDLPLKVLRAQIALVSQDVVLFNDSIANNIAYGRDDISQKEILQVAQAADLGAFIASLPDGLDTIIGDRGVRISGGQRQRIAIARAMIKDAPILIMDEATSALDNTSEAAVKQAIDRLRQGKTTLVVAHRLSTVVNADRIVVLDQGKIAQQGSHDELIRQSGLYASLYAQLQSAINESTDLQG